MIELTDICNHLQVAQNDLQICIIYPGSSFSGFSSLAISNIYSTLNGIKGISCDIGFGDSTKSLFLEKTYGNFHILAFSITYEEHLFEIVKILQKSKIEPLREKRTDEAPLILAGGIGVSYNPVPFIPIVDTVYLGEAEEKMEEIFNSLSGKKEKNLLMKTLISFDNIIISDEYKFHFNGEKTQKTEGKAKKIFRSKEYPSKKSCSCFITEETAFKNMFLLELSRGCPEKCRFCVASAMGLPYREKKIETIEKELKEAAKVTDKIGLIGAAVSDYSQTDKLYKLLKKYDLKGSFSSLRVSSLSQSLLKIIKISEQKTVTIAPETGNDNLRFKINKKVKNRDFLEFCEKLFEEGAENLKLYYLIGLPTETEKDLESIIVLTKEFHSLAMKFWKRRKRAGKISISINPVIPKPFTPMQWYGMPKKSDLEKKLRFLSKHLKRITNSELTVEPLKNAITQAIVSRGDTRIGEAAVNTVKHNTNFRKSLKEMNLNFESLYSREREENELFPWEIVDSGIKRGYLLSEYKKIYKGEVTPSCFKGCRLCGLC